MKIRMIGLAVMWFSLGVGTANAQGVSLDTPAGAPATQVIISGEVKYIRVGNEVTYIQLLTTDQQGNIIEWELERPTIDRRPRLRGQTEPGINVRDWISVLVVPSPTLEPKGQILSASRVQPPMPVE